MPPYDRRVSGRAVCPLCQGVASSEAEMVARSRVGSLPSSEAEMICPLEGRFATLERGGDAGRSRGVSTGALKRGGDRPTHPRGVRMGRMPGFFESFPSFQIGRRPWAFVGPIALIMCLRFRVILVPRLGCP